MRCLEKMLINSEVLRWALANPDCRITEVPHWVIMALLEDIVHHDCELVEHLVMALDDSQGKAMEADYLEAAAEKLMTNILLASLYEDGHIEILQDLLGEPRLFAPGDQPEINITLTPSGREIRIWEELDLVHTVTQASVQ